MKITYQGTADSLTVFVDGQATTLRAGTVQFNQVKKALLDGDLNAVPTLLTPAGALQRYLGDQYSADGSRVFYKGKELPDALEKRIYAMAGEGLDPSPLLRFYDRLDQNPSFRSREQLYNFLQHLDIAIEPDGTFLAYKGVKSNYTDCHTGTVPNTPGMVHAMDRNLVSDDPETPCHYGFHVGALSYAHGFGHGVTMICRVDPKDVVCVPNDNAHRKMRVCKYEVVGEWNGQDQMSMVDEPDLEDEDVDLADFFEPDQDDDNEYDDVDDEDRNHDDGDIPFVCPAIADTTFQVQPIPKNCMDGIRTTRELMEQPIELLRKYASGTLKIVGASKIAGGKSALVSKIMRVRRNRGL